MLTKMRIQCSGKFPEPTNTIAFRMTDGTVRQITFDKVSVNTDNGTTLVFECEPQDFKPWRMEAILHKFPDSVNTQESALQPNDILLF